MPGLSQKILRRLIIAAIWLLAGVLYSLQSYYYRQQLGVPFDLWPVVITDLTYFIIWGIFSPLIFYLADRFPLERQTWLKFGFLHLVLGTLISMLQRTIYTLIYVQIRPDPETPLTLQRLYLTVVAYFDYGLIIYAATLFCYVGFTYYQRYVSEQLTNARLSADLTEARLEALQAQLHPHSLFNALNAINTLIVQDPPTAIRMVEKLSDLLRYSLQRENRQKVPLSEAMHYIDLYLNIQETRFGERLKIYRDIPDDLLNAGIPALLLQPVVENAVQHGIAEQLGTGILRISARRDKDQLMLAVEDNGPGLISGFSQAETQGIGLSNTRARLENLYGDRAELTLASDNGVKAVIAIPYEVWNDQNDYR